MTNSPLPFWKERAFRCILSRSYASFMLIGIVIMSAASLSHVSDHLAWLSFMAVTILYTALLGLVIALPAGALWFALRPLRGEPVIICMLFGLLPGLIFGMLLNNPFHDLAAVVLCTALGLVGGLLFWLMGKLPALIGARDDP